MIEEQIPRKIAETGLKMKLKVKDSVLQNYLQNKVM